MAKHTPGPWEARPDDRGAGSYPYCTVWAGPPGLNGSVVAAIRLDDEGRELPFEANARLIAAAPELLEALKGVLAVADRKTNEFDAARAAIAKATKV